MSIVKRCVAGEQGKLWEMRHSILLNNQRLTNESFATFAQDLKLKGTFNRCYAGRRLERETGIEPATSSLGSSRSTAELLPLSDFILAKTA